MTARPVNGGTSIQEYFDVAVDEEDQALEAVRIAAKIADGTPIEVVSELSPTDIGKAGLVPGEVLSVRKAIAGAERRGREKWRQR